jgi:tetratricopeptide (TPR) repeat protein
MLPPSPMLAKINSVRGTIFVFALALLLSGCTPAGPRALLKGKKYLDHGDTAAAVAQFRKATTLLATNANAWNYFGVALQRAGQPEEAATAYQTALKLDRDLVEAHFNLGSLALEQNRPDVAKTEFTAYTLRRPNEAAGWLKLGAAQLKAGDTIPAERSFSAVLALKTSEAEAYNGLGLASIKLGKPRDAAQFFIAALQSRASFAPAQLNLATVNQQYLHDNKAALENYRSYLALTPRPASYDEVKAIVAGLEQSDVASAVMAPAVVIKTSAPPPEVRPRIVPAPTQHLTVASRPEPVENPVPRIPRPTFAPNPAPAPVVTPVPAQEVQVQPEPPIVTTPKSNPPVVIATTRATNLTAATESLEVPMPEEEPKPGFWHRLFKASKAPSAEETKYRGEDLTPIPATPEPAPTTKAAEPKPAEVKHVSPASFARYNYTSPRKPMAGDRRAAAGAFTKARLAEQDEKWPDAEQWYQSAAETDPAWFEAQYNTGVIAHRLRNYTLALPRYELAISLQPDSVDARYNFALALKAAGYVPDAAEEFKKILATNPGEVRAHLALANLSAQSLRDTAQARRHYLKVLELQPDNPQAADIRFWLSANPK